MKKIITKMHVLLLCLLLLIYIYYSFIFTIITCSPNVILYLIFFLIPFFFFGVYIIKTTPLQKDWLVSFTEVLGIVNLFYLLYVGVMFPILALPGWSEYYLGGGWSEYYLGGGWCTTGQGFFINNSGPIYIKLIFIPSVALFISAIAIVKFVHKRTIQIESVLRMAFRDMGHNMYTFLTNRIVIVISVFFIGMVVPFELSAFYDHIKFDVKDSVYTEPFKNEGLSTSTFYFRDIWGNYYFTDSMHYRREIFKNSGIYYIDIFSYDFDKNQKQPVKLIGNPENIKIFPTTCNGFSYFTGYHTDGEAVFYKNYFLRDVTPSEFKIVCGELTIIGFTSQTEMHYNFELAKTGNGVYYENKIINNLNPTGLEYKGNGKWKNIQGVYKLLIRPGATKGDIIIEAL